MELDDQDPAASSGTCSPVSVPTIDGTDSRSLLHRDPRSPAVSGREDRFGKVLCPPVDVDPDSLEDLSVDDLVEVGPAGCVTSWTWLREPRPGNPLERPFAWALIRLDGADSALLHAVDAGSESAMRTGMRVVPRFRDERNGDIRDIACFVPEG